MIDGDSFRRTKQDPLQAIRDLPKDVEEALTFVTAVSTAIVFAVSARAAIMSTL
jgi:hypothetical protein